MIDGVGKGDPERNGYSEYGSIGRYTISGTLPSSKMVIPPWEATVELDRNSESVDRIKELSLSMVVLYIYKVCKKE